MGLYQAICPCCGHVNKHLYLEETEGFFECEACGQVANANGRQIRTVSGSRSSMRIPISFCSGIISR